MNHKKYRQLKLIVNFFVVVLIALSMLSKSYLLALVSIITGMLFISMVKVKAKIKADEREISIQQKAAQLAYSIFTPTLGIGAVILLVPVYSGLEVFDKGEFLFLESLGLIFAYLVLFLIVLYALSYHFLNRKYGGTSSEK